MDATPNLSLPLIAAAQAQKHVTHNEALAALDALVQLSVADRTRTLPPPNPVDGDRHIVGAAASAEWEGWDGSVALYSAGGWMRLSPRPGWLAWIADEAVLVVWNGVAWQSNGNSATPLTLGVNAVADQSSRLAVKSDEILFSHDDITPGSGSLRLTANKALPVDTASMLFKTGWSGRAEIGLAGSDGFSIKVSADGATWVEALLIDPVTGVVSLPATPGSIKVLTAEDTSGTSMPDMVYTDQVFTTTSRNDFGNAAWDGREFTVPEDGTYDFGVSLSVNGLASTTSVYLFRNGVDQVGFNEVSGVSGQNTIMSRAVMTLTAGDTVCVRMRHNAGSAQLGLTGALYSIIQV
ncbi:DUF2793 domain-containing protein [uncultured Hoeflea sp.]|uniref:DUF2793 domain-containing protein n=1 Tax=uncultured Hoeflea sp. TaxID=538666 RepID=UPI0026286AEA|nr:DUF2793 domain-containing protein [uncultured Hoeflea sp.]